MLLLSGDLHLDDNPDNEYRWGAVEQIWLATTLYDIDEVFILGDAWDRRDRHSAILVNRTVDEFRRIAAHTLLTVIRGNHDTTLREPYFWEFLNEIEGLSYVVRPQPWGPGGLALLPFTPRPKRDWAELQPLSKYKALFMHATVGGAVSENGEVLQNDGFPLLPRSCAIYSGDVHVPQQVGNVTYVGAPHPVKFGDRYPCRLLLLNDEFAIDREILLHPPRKMLLDIASTEDLAGIAVQPGDQVRVRLNFRGEAPDWGANEAAIARWAAERGIIIAGMEVTVDTARSGTADPLRAPADILRAFAAQERLSERLTEVGLDLLKEVE